MLRFFRRVTAIVALSSFVGCGSNGATIGPSAATSTPAASATQSATPVSSPIAGASSTPIATPTSTSTTPATSSSSATIPFAASPDPDPFYAQPSPFPNVANGTILASRKVTYAPVGGVTQPNTAYQLKFASRDTNMNPIAAVTTIVLPTTPSATSPQPLLVDAIAEDGLGSQCAPSHGLTGSTADSVEQSEAPLANTGLANGWIVDFPDYEGPYSEYAAPAQSGQIALDSIFATESFSTLGLSAKTPVGIYGYSGGGFAAAWSATLQASYAPGLDIVGIASGGTPASPKGIVQNIDTNQVSNAAFFALIFSAVVGENRAYPTLVTPILNAKGVAAATSLANGCVGATSNGAAAPTGTTSDYTTTSDPLDAPNVVSVLSKVTLPLAGFSPVSNVFVFHSQVDELIPIAGADAMVGGWCSAGSSVEYYRGATGDHVAFEADAGPLAFAYLLSRFQGGPTVTPPTTADCNT